MMLRRLAGSPLMVVGSVLVCGGLWAAAYQGPRRAEADDGEALAAARAPTPTADAVHTREGGPRLLGQPDPEVPGLPIAIEDADGHSLDHFHEALTRAAEGQGQARILFYGASHVASDTFTGPIRRALQERFGDAGHGFVIPGHPWRSYRHRGVRIASSRGRWSSSKVRVSTRTVDHYGLAGTFIETRHGGAWGRVATATRGVGQAVGVFDLYYLAQPQGGSFDVYIDGERVKQVDTGAEEAGPGYATFPVEDGEHELLLRANGDGPVRIFGVSMEREQPGVVVDTLGINGARARYHLQWDEALYREHLARRRPDLVVLAYGTNESGDDHLPIETYEEQLRAVLTRVQSTVPEASCLLVGPSDRPMRLGRDLYEDRPRTGAVIEVQRRVAREMGCGFYDLVAFQGGPLSMVSWVEAGYGAPDHIHYTRRGYARLGELLLGAMLEHFEPPTGVEMPVLDTAVAEADDEPDEG